MAAGCKKCDPHELCEECPEWIFTLADLIMCMMGLFVILWVLKPGGQPTAGTPEGDKLNQVVAAIREGFGYIPDPDSSDPIDMLLIDKLQRKLKQNGPGENGQTKQKTDGAEGTDPEVESIRRGPQAAIGGKIGFARGDAKLSRDALATLEQVAIKIRGHRQIVEIKGHTSLDDLGESATPEEKLALSVRRAVAVHDYLISQGVSPETLRVKPCSTFEPVQQRAYSTDLQALNRRVEVEVTRQLVEELQDRPKQVSAVNANPAQPGATASVQE